MMTPDTARAALIFLQRTDIKGSEAMVLLQVMRVLEAYANAPPADAPEAAPPVQLGAPPRPRGRPRGNGASAPETLPQPQPELLAQEESLSG